MTWTRGFLNVAWIALQKEDLRQRLIYAPSAAELPFTPGIVKALETTAVLAIYEASFSLRGTQGDILKHERRYPNIVGQNPKRADLAFKESGRGKNWWYIEVKYYSAAGVREDVDKLRSIQNRARRWLLVYLVRTDGMQPLVKLLEKHSDLLVVEGRKFDTYFGQGVPGTCELALARVTR
jgi:hypothetical protein